MENKRKIRLGISAGDLNGIGVEILLKTFKDSRMFEFCTPVVYASQKVINFNIGLFIRHFGQYLVKKK